MGMEQISSDQEKKAMFNVGEGVMPRWSTDENREEMMPAMKLDKNYYVVDQVDESAGSIHLKGTSLDDWYEAKFFVKALDPKFRQPSEREKRASPEGYDTLAP